MYEKRKGSRYKDSLLKEQSWVESSFLFGFGSDRQRKREDASEHRVGERPQLVSAQLKWLQCMAMVLTREKGQAVPDVFVSFGW